MYRDEVFRVMSGKAKLVLALALVAMIYFLVSGDDDPVEVDIDDE